MTAYSIESIAKVAHDANRSYCETLGDWTQRSWEDAEDWQKKSAIEGVHFRLRNPMASSGAQHAAWMADKIADGWKWGPTKNADKKEHPCLVAYDDLPIAQKVKDALFCAVVVAMSKLVVYVEA